MVPRPQLCRIHERHVQEGERARETHRMVSFGPQAAGERSGDQRAVQAVHAKSVVGDYRCAAERGGRADGCILRG